VGVDIALKHPRVVDGKIICARTDEGHVIKRLQLQQRYALRSSESENQDRYPPILISLKNEEDFIVGLIVWAWIDLG
jgi:phage repressor protein C with HTH and peptisase S24 domain